MDFITCTPYLNFRWLASSYKFYMAHWYVDLMTTTFYACKSGLIHVTFRCQSEIEVSYREQFEIYEQWIKSFVELTSWICVETLLRLHKVSLLHMLDMTYPQMSKVFSICVFHSKLSVLLLSSVLFGAVVELKTSNYKITSELWDHVSTALMLCTGQWA